MIDDNYDRLALRDSRLPGEGEKLLHKQLHGLVAAPFLLSKAEVHLFACQTELKFGK
jgi:hypothetical protein